MSKVKHFLRKLHIGDHHQPQQQVPSLDSSPQTTTPSNLNLTASSSENENSTNNNDDDSFNFLEEEYQMQLALAISVSDQSQTRVDSDTDVINATKQISLGISPSQSVAESLSLQYWSYNVLNYDEKVMDGFYDVCGIDSNLLVQAKLPSLDDLKAASVRDNVGYDVVLVNRTIDLELQKLEEIVHLMSLQFRSINGGLHTSFLVQKIANLVVDRMGGPVSDVEEMFRRCRARNNGLRIHFNTVTLPLGYLDVGHSRQRALLFKVLADRINLACKLVKGSYYTGTDEGAVNLIKLDGSEFIIDLMGAPGTLIPTEIPSSDHSFDSDTVSTGIAASCDNSAFPSSDKDPRAGLFFSGNDESTKTRTLSSQMAAPTAESNYKRRTTQNFPIDMSEHDSRHLHVSPGGVSDVPSDAKMQISGNYHIEDVPGFSGKLPLESDDLVSVVRSRKYGCRGGDMLETNEQLRRERVIGHSRLDISLDNSGQSLIKSIHCDSSNKHLDMGFEIHGQEVGGDELPIMARKEQNVLTEDRTDGVIRDRDTGFSSEVVNFARVREDMKMAHPGQSNADVIQNMQVDSVFNKVAEILWEDLKIGERIGIGSYGEVYRAEWNGTEVAVKKFIKQDISSDALEQFKCEIEIMSRLRHPNIVLFMGAVTRPPNLSILTEFLPRGSLFKLLHRQNNQIDEKRRIQMALDVAKGMNYLHSSHPTIVHRDLKTPNLLVDKNWAVKVCDFGMSRLQHHTFLSSKSTAGTAEWMAPEVLRNEPSNEKSDVYSFGVILWELSTLQVPWTGLNSMQVVGAVGFQGRHLDIPPTVDPMVAQIITDCWNRNPLARPAFADIITRIKCLSSLSCLEQM